jgi:predicted phosphodiesterase
MKYGILGDVHANLSALETVLAEMDRAGVDRVLSVGDVVGYGAAPRECLAILREREVATVKGNHDAACVGELDERYFNAYARAAVVWTRGVLERSELDWLADLPMTLELEHCQMAHGTLFRPDLYDYVLGPDDADPSLDAMTRAVCFVGHSHVPISLLRLRDEPGRTAYTFDADVDLSEASRALINVGSVGQPRDDDPRTAWVLFDSEARRAWIHRVEYDIAREMQRIRSAGLPDVLAERLRLGV